MKFKLTSIVLCILLVICTMPVSVLADAGTTPYYTSYGRMISDGVVSYNVTYNEAGTVRFVLLRSDMAQPSGAQVAALQDAGGNSVTSPYSGSIACTAGMEATLPIDFGSLAPNKYNLFIACDDGFGNISDVLWLLMDGAPSFEIMAKVTFNVTDGTDPVSGATVKVGSETKTTDGSGSAAFTLSGGDFTYIVQKDGYKGVWGSYTADKQTDTKTVALTSGSGGYYSAILNVKDDKGTNLKNAKVTIGTETKTADSNGNVEFFFVPGDCSYTASAMGRITKNGSFTIGAVNYTGNIVLATDPSGADMVINSHRKGKLGDEINAILSANSLGADAVGSLTVHGGTMDANDFSYTGIKQLLYSGTEVFTSVDLSDTVLDGNILPESAFSYGAHLTSIILPDSVTEIGAYAFGSCSSLTSYTFPEDTTKIGDCVFESCSSLESVTIPAGITSIGAYIFSNYGWGAAPVKDVFMLSTDPSTITLNSNAFNADRNVVLHVPGGSAGAYYSDARDGDATDGKWFGMYIDDPDGAAPVINGVYAEWSSSGTKFYIEIKSDLPGQYYYAVAADGAAEPAIDTSGAGQDVDSFLLGYTEVTGLTGTPNDLYIVLMGINGKLSNILKMDIPASDSAPVDVTVIGHVSGNLADEINEELAKSGMSYNFGMIAGLKVSGGAIGEDDADFLSYYVYNLVSADLSETSFEDNAVQADFLDYGEYLKTITLPGSVTAIGDEAFYELDVLESITLGSAAPPTVAEYVFYEIPSRAVVYVPKGSKSAYLAVDDGNTRDSKWYGLTVVEYPKLSSSVSGGNIYVGGRIILTPNVSGGEWDWDDTFFSATFNSPATFTALKTGTSTITYTVNGVSESYVVTIRETELPSTGQDFNAVIILIAAASGFGCAAGLLLLIKRKASRA